MSLHRLPGGRWRVRWREGSTNRSRSFDRKRDAELWDAEVRRRRQLGTLAQLDAGKRTLAEYVAKVWGPEHAAHLAPNTRRIYRGLWTVHLADDLGSLRLRDVTSARLGAWQAARDRAGAGRTALNMALTMLGSILQRAARDGEIQSNPVRLVPKLPARHSEEVTPLSPADVERIRSHLDLRDATLVSVLAYSGLRPGEAWALRWGDVRERTIHVQRALDGTGKAKGTKTRSSRTVRLLAPLAKDLAAWRFASGRPADDALVFPNPHGELADGQQVGRWRAKRWRAACEAAGLSPNPRPYDLRHSFASLLLAEGRTIHYVARQLGHDPRLTLTTYGHVIDEYEESARIDAEAEIRAAREGSRSLSVPSGAAAVSS